MLEILLNRMDSVSHENDVKRESLIYTVTVYRLIKRSMKESAALALSGK